MPSRLIASSLALIAFAAAIVAGITVNNPATTTIWRALVAMSLCYIVGSILGTIAQRTLDEHLDQYRREHPIESESPHRTGEHAANDDAVTLSETALNQTPSSEQAAA